MAEVYMKDKPEADTFAYAYVEDAEGKLVRISLDKLRTLVGSTGGSEFITTEIVLPAINWVASDDGIYYTQPVQMTNVTVNSRIDLQPTPTQILQLMDEEISMFVSNNNGVITVYAVNGSPSTDMTIKAVIVELT